MLRISAPAALLAALLATAVGCSTAGSRYELVERVDFEPDASKWKQAERREIPGGMTEVRYVPKGDSAEAWSQMITLYTLRDEQGAYGASDLAASELGEARSRCDSFEVLSVHESTRESALYEWRVPTPCGSFPVQAAIERRVRGKTAIFGLTYKTRQPSMPEDARNRWMATLSEFSIKTSKRPKVR